MPLPRNHILFLRLHDAYDPNGALHAQDDLKQLFRTHCMGFHVLPEVVFRSTHDLLRAVRAVDDNSLAHVCILTHGEMFSITTGPGSMHMFDRNCVAFIRLLRRKLMRKASILLCACNTGKVVHGPHRVDNDLSLRLLSFHNWCYPNFACMLAMRLPDHPIFCTPHEQTSGELVAKFIGSCGASTAPKIVYLSSRQSMFRYINSSAIKCDFDLPTELGIGAVHLVFPDALGGGGHTRRVKTMLREYEQQTKSNCMFTRREINQFIQNKRSKFLNGQK